MIISKDLNPAQVSETFSERLDFCDVQRRVRVMLRDIAGWREIDESKELMLARVARACGLSQSRITDIWYGEARRIDAHEFLNIQAAAHRAKSRWNGFDPLNRR